MLFLKPMKTKILGYQQQFTSYTIIDLSSTIPAIC